MRSLSIIIFVLISSSSHNQTNSLEKGSKWTFDYPYARTERDSSGNEKLVYSPHLRLFQYSEGLAKVQFKKQSGFVDSNKIIVIPIIYDDVSGTGFKDSRVIVEQGGRTGVIDTAGNIVIPFIYDGRLRYHDSLFYVVQDYNWGYLDINGNIVLPIDKHKRKCFSSRITYDEIIELREEYYLKDSLQKSTTISKEEAIKLAKQKGYYREGEFPFDSKVNLESSQWFIKSSKYDGVTYKGYCKHTNGCAIIKKMQIIIDAETGKIISKSRSKTKIACYE